MLGALPAGCGGGGEDYETGAVHGTVTCNGEIVTGGAVTFNPVAGGGRSSLNPGGPARGTIESDGSYKLTTYKPGDGAVTGPCIVRVSAPPVEWEPGPDDDPEDDRPPLPLICGQPKNATIKVTVVAGDNTIDLKLPFPDSAEKQ